MLDPATSHGPRQTERSRALLAPHYDAEFGAWIGPFFMAPINTRIVRRSAALFAEWQEPYGPDFVYQEALKYDPPLARAKAWAGTGAIAAFYGAVKQPLTRRLVSPWLPRPGAGPSVQTMDRGWFTCDLLGIAEDGRRVRGLISYAGDPGNRATTVRVGLGARRRRGSTAGRRSTGRRVDACHGVGAGAGRPPGSSRRHHRHRPPRLRYAFTICIATC
jgi:short subunit dehydrogenase-like uncharacterized protein